MPKHVIVTGASSGIGFATALEFARLGHRVLGVARRADRLQELQKHFPKHIETAVCDLSLPDHIEDFIHRHHHWLAQSDVVVQNAGLALGRDALHLTPDSDIQTMIQTNIHAVMQLSKAVIPHMIARQSGHLIHLGSVAGETAYAGGAVYCATKAAIHMFTSALRQDLAGTGVRVSTVAPGRVETEFSVVRYKGDQDTARKVYEGYRPLKSEDIARTITWISEQPPHVNIEHVLVMSTDQPNATNVVPLKS